MSKISVLFLCTGNSARSQMAEALLRSFAGDRFEPYSAGLEPKEINPLTNRVMEEIGINISSYRSKSVMEYMGKLHFAYLIIVCEAADNNCPSTFPGVGQRLKWPFEDPAAFQGSDDDRLQKFRQVRDQIATRLRSWLAELGT
jgi:arsenate reductase (thioredoxin)